GAPTCAVGDGIANRRLIYAVVTDCSTLSGGQTPVTAKGIVTFFLLQPLEPGGGFGTMLGEYVALATPNNNTPGGGGPAPGTAAIFDIVQLFR
ncbi:MAG: hypothetical protein ACREDJ_03610, partial [Methylocella sp.]